MLKTKIIAGLIGGAALFFLVAGSILPWDMARSYINALRSLSGQTSLESFLQKFGSVLEHPSPVGREEVVKFLSGDLKSMIASQEELVARTLADFIEPHLFKDEVRHLLTKADINYLLWKRFGKKEDFIKTAEAYQAVGKIAPNLPQPLYGLYNIFLEAGQKDLANQAGKEIIRLWPTETRVKINQ